MMRSSFLLVAIILVCLIKANASIPYNQYWSKANNFYVDKEYDSAVIYYEKIAASKPANHELYYNLGNAYYRLNQIGLSILNYKRALRLQPNYSKAQDNLVLAQSRMSKNINPAKDIFFIRWWKAITNPGSAQILAIISLVLFLIVAGIFFYSRWKKNASQVQQTILYTSIFLFCIMMITAIVSARKKSSHDEAVVLDSDAIFKVDIKGTKTEMLPEGTIVEFEEAEGDWIKVELPDSRQGWMRTSSLEII